MDNKRKTLLAFGYVRKQHKLQNIEFLPEDIIGLFVVWLSFNDHFDKNKCHPALDLETDNEYQTLRMEDEDADEHIYYSAVGWLIIEKGQKQTWTFPVYKPNGYSYAHGGSMQIGIMDDSILSSSNEPYVDDFTNIKWNGWGLYLYGMTRYHNDQSDGGFEYAQQFKYSEDKPVLMTMILDLTRDINKNGVLSFEIDGDINYENYNPNASKVLYDGLDINKQYRMVVAVHKDEDKGIKLSLCD